MKLTNLESLEVCDNENISNKGISNLVNLSDLKIYNLAPRIRRVITDGAFEKLTNLTKLEAAQI
jgi:hypothetical protein